MIIEMEFVQGNKLSSILESNDYEKILKETGKIIGILHNKNIIHGDLTTSNIIYNKKTNEIRFIDFGLSFVSDKIEDKAVDIHLFRQALESKHYSIFKKGMKAFLQGYKQTEKFNEIMKRFEKVESRGRNKAK